MRDAWVPPQSSTLSLPMWSMRTESPYFSSKIIIAPFARASAWEVTSVRTDALASTSAFTRSSMRVTSSALSGRAAA